MRDAAGTLAHRGRQWRLREHFPSDVFIGTGFTTAPFDVLRRDVPVLPRRRPVTLSAVVSTSILLEISVQSAEAAVAAARAGAHRIELCAELRVGGLTPSEDLMLRVRELVRVPIFAMIRPREGDFVYSDGEFERMRSDIESARRTGMDGVVLGVLTQERRVDVARARELVKLARPLPVTFHRAFDDIADLDAGLEDVIETGATRLLTSGGASSAPAGIESLARLAATAKERIIVIPGGGINATNIVRVAQQTGAPELHSGLGSVLGYGQREYHLFQSEVRKLAAKLASVT